MRERGYYWVRHSDSPDEWEICFVASGMWSRCGDDMYCDDADFEEIGPKVEPPQ